MGMREFVAVIMAGGVGQRFWPLSTTERPKQFLDLERCGRTLLQATFDRLLKATNTPKHIFVITGAAYKDLVQNQLPDLPVDNLLLEPTGRDTAPAIALALLEVRQRLGNPMVGVFPSDHRVGDVPAFLEALQRGYSLADSTDGLVTLGIKPDRPATGYGYIERGNPVGEGFEVAHFVEKPPLEQAERYLVSGLHSWNGGIFLWRAETILNELALYAPNLYYPLETAHQAGTVPTVFPTLAKISIDYAVMEKTEMAYVVPAEFDWDDLGDWRSLERLLNRDKNDLNTVVGQHVGLEATDNIIYSDDGDMIVTLGVKDLVIVKRENTVLLVHKGRVQDIKKLLGDERLANLDMGQGAKDHSPQPPNYAEAFQKPLKGAL